MKEKGTKKRGLLDEAEFKEIVDGVLAGRTARVVS